MLKIYKSNSVISVVVKIGGGYGRISFAPHSMGTSTYATRDPEEQKALESNYLFNDLYRLAETVDEKKEAAALKKKIAAKDKEQERPVITQSVDSLTEAKDFLADRFGVVRTTLRSKEDILNCAAEHKVVFEGI